jgi:hypothetical protein
METQVALFHLIGGQIIIGKLEAERTDALILHEPFEVLASPGPRGLAISLVPFGELFGALPPVPELDITDFALARSSLVPEQMLSQYTTATTGLVVAQRPGLELVKR